MSAIRLARGFTGRDLIVKFDGCYHGHSDSLLVKAGSGVLTLGIPNSPGVPAAIAEQTLTLPFNDLNAVAGAFEQYPGQIAAVILEPVAGNMGCVPPKAGYLEGLRELTSRHASLLIFDEVMTGFRVSRGGAQERYGVNPDGSRYKHYYASESVGLATGFLLAALHRAGLASLTHTPAPMGFLREVLGRPDNERPFMIVVAGYPADGAEVPDIGRKALDDIATFL